MDQPETEPPNIPRHNPWGFWNPVSIDGRRIPQEEYFRHIFAAKKLPSREAMAVHQYCAFTGHEGIEFVLLSRHVDRSAFRRLTGGIILVPCEETRAFQRGPGLPPPWFLYDGWLPLKDSSEETILRGLALVEETMSAMAYAHAVPARWIVKYTESVEQGDHVDLLREIDDGEFEHVSRLLDSMSRLPLVVRDAVVRAIHWLQHARQSRHPADRFLARYYAFEGLCLALWENATDLELPIPAQSARESKKQRKTRIDAEARAILDKFLSSDPQKAVSEAYFSAIVPIKKRTRLVLTAALGSESTEPEWILDGSDSASSLRSELAHGRMAGLDVFSRPGLRDNSERLAKLTKQLVTRAVARKWQGAALESRTIRFTTSQSFGDSFIWSSNGAVQAVGDFRITLGLIAGKGLAA